MGKAKSVARFLWRHVFWIHAAFAGVLAGVSIAAGDLHGATVGGIVAVYSLMLWERDRSAGYWRKRADEWKARAWEILGIAQSQVAGKIDWRDFCESVKANTPEDQREAVQYAMDLAVASHIPTGKVH